MTTPAAARQYLAEHMAATADRGWAIYNPLKRMPDELPIIFGWNNGGSPGWYNAVLIAEDGTPLGGHLCSHEYYMEGDLGILNGSRPDRHETFRNHYPDGYRMEFVKWDDPRLCAAINLNQEKAEAKKAASETE